MYPGEIPNAPVREAIERSGESWTSICRRLGWVRPDDRAETSRLKRRVGAMATTKGGHNQKRSRELVVTKGMRYETALAIVQALGADPVDFDL